MMTKKRYGLRGITIPELLVVMIIASILFISVMNGLGLFRRYASRLTDRISINTDFYNSFYSLEKLITGADSVRLEEMAIKIYLAGGLHASLYEADSSVIVDTGNRCDTLFYKAYFEQNVPRAYDLLDSIVVFTEHNGDKIRLRFNVNTPIEYRVCKTIEDYEINYLYE